MMKRITCLQLVRHSFPRWFLTELVTYQRVALANSIKWAELARSFSFRALSTK